MRALATIALVVAGLAALVVWMAGGTQSPRRFEAEVQKVVEPVTTETSTLTVIVWNISWAYGWGSEGSGGRKDAAHFEASLEKIARVISESGADIALLQEVDFNADRSYGIDQAEELARATGLGYVAPALSWVANYVPFPYWPPSDQFGAVRSGGAVLSRYPIELNRVTLLEKPQDFAFIYNLFYPFRYFQETKIRFFGAPLRVYNAHLDAYSKDNRGAQARTWSEVLSDGPDELLLIGGDFNTVPPESPQKSDFDDEPETSFEGDDTLAVLRSTAKLQDAFEPEAFARAPDAYFTFPSHAPNRKLDHLLHTPDIEVKSAEVLRDAAGEVSDHLPLLVRFGPRSR